ncbi:hypothetical protein [Clostridioides difficile]|uniref:hypothetical protein n=1 Tax=Clostridioides difficile TaxID=1496 RepID=UPI003A94ED21
MANISREHLSRIEAGKVTLTEDMKHTLLEAVEKFNPDTKEVFGLLPPYTYFQP